MGGVAGETTILQSPYVESAIQSCLQFWYSLYVSELPKERNVTSFTPERRRCELGEDKDRGRPAGVHGGLGPQQLSSRQRRRVEYRAGLDSGQTGGWGSSQLRLVARSTGGDDS